MKKSQLRKIIKESIKELMTEQTNPDARRIYGCDCSVAPGRVYTQTEVIAYNASNPNSIFDDLGGGGYLPAGQNGELYLICEDNNYWNIPNAIVDCSTPQDGQIIYQTGGVTNTIRIADNGVMSEWGNGPIKSHQTSTCGGTGVFPHDCSGPVVEGCMDNDPNTFNGVASNYNPNATVDDGSCQYYCYICLDGIVQLPPTSQQWTGYPTDPNSLGGWGYCGFNSTYGDMNMDMNWSGFDDCGSNTILEPTMATQGKQITTPTTPNPNDPQVKRMKDLAFKGKK